jgi:hypothetical protein
MTSLMEDHAPPSFSMGIYIIWINGSDILPDKDPYHNRGRDKMRKKGGPEFECLWM